MKKIRKNITFAVALVASAFNAAAPRRKENPRPNIIKINIIDKPYINGADFVCLLSPLLVKNDTVKGIIGNTHGVNIAAKPAINAPRKKANNESELDSFVLFCALSL